MRARSTWIWATWVFAWLTCACAPHKPDAIREARSASLIVSEHDALAEVCRCSHDAGAQHLAAALASTHGGRVVAAAESDHITCASAASGIPSAAAYASSEDWPDFQHEIARADGSAALMMSDDGAFRLRFGDDVAHLVQAVHHSLLTGERDRLRSIGVAFRENALASQACHAIALGIAVHTSVGRGTPTKADRTLVDEVAADGRRAAMRAALALALATAFDAALRRRLPPDALFELARALDASELDGVLSDDAGRAWATAAKLVHDRRLAAWFDERRDALRDDAARPITFAATPSLATLARTMRQQRANGIEQGAELLLRGVVHHDVGAVMRGAAPLHGRHHPARHVLEAMERARANDLRGAFEIGRDLVPIYGQAAKPLEALAKRLRVK